jgi:hypothetical protein
MCDCRPLDTEKIFYYATTDRGGTISRISNDKSSFDASNGTVLEIDPARIDAIRFGYDTNNNNQTVWEARYVHDKHNEHGGWYYFLSNSRCVLPESLRATAAAASSTADMRAVSRTPFQAREKGAAAATSLAACAAAACMPAHSMQQQPASGRSYESIYPKSTRRHGRSTSAGSPGPGRVDRPAHCAGPRVWPNPRACTVARSLSGSEAPARCCHRCGCGAGLCCPRRRGRRPLHLTCQDGARAGPCPGNAERPKRRR